MVFLRFKKKHKAEIVRFKKKHKAENPEYYTPFLELRLCLLCFGLLFGLIIAVMYGIEYDSLFFQALLLDRPQFLRDPEEYANLKTLEI
jgi:hypothetical protein